MQSSIRRLLASGEGEAVVATGWVRSVRRQKRIAFLTLNDGSTADSLQVVARPEDVAGITTGSSVEVVGSLASSPGNGQVVEMQASEVILHGGADAEGYPLQKKDHSAEFVRSLFHLNPRTSRWGSIWRLRSSVSHQLHTYFQNNDFVHVHTPILTELDCEGGGEVFSVDASGKPDYFGSPAHLTVSGQLELEIYACSMSRAYNFSPVFRAENSNTTRHLSEFWMLEAELAFADLAKTMATCEDSLRSAMQHTLAERAADVAACGEQSTANLEMALGAPFAHLTHAEAVEILQRSTSPPFTIPATIDGQLSTEHEKFLASVHCARPVFIRDYPKSLKPFYMRTNDDDKTVACFDLLFPGIGEVVGGSEREERIDVLEARFDTEGLCKQQLGWYLDLRRFGTVRHAGYGLGFDRLVQFITGSASIREVSSFPRHPGCFASAEKEEH